MEQHNLPQGSAAWHAHRAAHDNASDAPVMLGLSPYRTRQEFVKSRATGVEPEHSAQTLALFGEGHRTEALAREVAERIVGAELYPVVGTNGRISASFDGLTMLEDTGYEHKLLNDRLRAAMFEGCAGTDLPMDYQVQLEQQCMVAETCDRILFMASKWEGETLVEERHCWYYPNPELAVKIMAGWEQFHADVAAYTPTAAAPLVVARAVTALPAISVQVAGEIVVRDNYAAFEIAARDFIDNKLIRKPETDQDFADLDLQIKAMKSAEEALDATDAQMLAQVAPIDAARRTKEMLHKLIRDNRLASEKILSAEKERRRGEIVAGGVTAFREHVAALNARLGKPYMPAIAADFGAAIKGKKNLDSMQDAVSVTLANAKIEANAIADKIDANLRTLRELAADHVFLFADTAQIVLKAPDDLLALVKNRIAEHQAAEQKRLDAERERIRQEEAERLAREQREEQARKEREAAQAAAVPPSPAPVPAPAPAPAAALAVSAPVARTSVALPVRASGLVEQVTMTAEGRISSAFVEPPSSAAMALATHAATAFASKFPTHPKPSQEWWAQLRQLVEAIDPAAVEKAKAQAAREAA